MAYAVNHELKQSIRRKYPAQKYVAQLLGMDESRLSQIIHGRGTVTLEMLRKFRQLLGEEEFKRAFPGL